MAEPPAADLNRDRNALLVLLEGARVDYVLIGGVGLESHQQPHTTLDLDITPAIDDDNLERLARLLNDLECALITDPERGDGVVALPSDYFAAATLRRADVWNLRTRHGDLDICIKPAGFPRGYDDLRERAQRLMAAATQIEVRVAALADIEHSKRTAGRPKDIEYLRRVGRLEAPPRT